jgi:TonB family protein
MKDEKKETKMKLCIRTVKRLILGIIMLWLSTGLFAGGDTLVSLRFYKGLRGDDIQKSGVVTSYHLEPMFVGNMMSATDAKQEQEELKRVFNLKGLKLMTYTRWGWQKNKKDKRFQVIILNGHEFVVNLALKEKPDRFKVEVMEKGTSANKLLLDTDISLPERKTAVFGFEDSLKKPYFLSFFREKDESVIREEPVPLSDETRPKILKRTTPLYPVDALKRKVKGKVILEVTTDTIGRVVNLLVVHGHPLLNHAAINAVKTWRFEPYKVNGEARSAVFTITVDFSMPDGPGKKESSIPAIWPTKGYLTSVFGFRIHPVTKKRAFHNGIDIATREGSNVVAAADGVVIVAEFREIYGNLVIIDHKNGYTTRYGQLKSFTVKKGETVKRGNLIGYVGSTGLSTAPHLHWEVRLNDKPVNPLKLIYPED